MGADRGYPATVGGRYPGVDYIIYRGGTRSAAVWFRFMVHVGGNVKVSGGNTYSIPPEDHEEDIAENKKWDVGDTGSRRGVEGG